MAVTIRKIVPGVLITNSSTAQYTTPVNTRTLLKKVTFTNTTALARLVTVHLVTAPDIGEAKNIIAVTQTLAPFETWEASKIEGHVLEAASSFRSFADLTLVVSLQITAVEIV